MKLHKVLAIGGVPYVLVKNEVRLDAKSPGRATFTIKATAPEKVRNARLVDTRMIRATRPLWAP